MSAQPSESWDDPASLIALKATGCDCRKHGYKHIHDLCIADAAKVRPAIVPLVEALSDLVTAFDLAIARGLIGGGTVNSALAMAAHAALNPEEAQ